MAYDEKFWRERRNWQALAGALTGPATRRDYRAMLSHIEAARAGGMPEERIRAAYAEVAKMIPSIPSLDELQGGPSATPTEPADTAADREPALTGEILTDSESFGESEAAVRPGSTPAGSPAAVSVPIVSTSTVERVSSPTPESTEPGGPAAPAVSSAPSVPTAPGTSSPVREPAPVTGRPMDFFGPAPSGPADARQIEHWRSILMQGSDSQKIEARWNLSLIYEQRGMIAEAIEMLQDNIAAGVRDPNTYRTLASLFRQQGRLDLARTAQDQAYRLGVTPIATQAAPSEEAPVLPPVPPGWRRPRPVWLVVALSIATFGLYGWYWLFATWRELKHESGRSSMHPLLHFLAILIVPIYGWFRFHAHMRTISEFARSAGTATTLSPGLCVWLFILTTVVNRVTIRIEPWTPTVSYLDPMVLAVDVILVAWPQAVLTEVWQRLPGGASPFRVHWFEWLMLILGGIAWTGIAAGALPL